MQDDGSFVEGGGSVSTHYRRNWCTNTGKSGLRWDGYYASGTGSVSGGLMVENVIWNASGVVVKGDNHNVSFNTIFDGADIPDSNPFHDRPRYQDETSFLGNGSIASIDIGAGTKAYDPLADQHTVIERNILDSVRLGVGPGNACPSGNCPLPGQYRQNLALENTSFDIRRELRDPYHIDFRPCPGSKVAAMGVGAYRMWSAAVAAAAGDAAAAGAAADASDASDAGDVVARVSASNETYWIPGRRLFSSATTPIPPDAAVAVKIDADLMFLPTRQPRQQEHNSLEIVAHLVYLGSSPSTMKLVGDVRGDANVVSPGRLAKNTRYEWRVDAKRADGTTSPGLVWSFTTGDRAACEQLPTPPPTPTPPTPTPPAPTPAVSCADCEKKECPGEAGKGQTCKSCVLAHNGAFEAAGCYVPGKGGRSAFVKKFCGV
jgi:hypothetical protein